MKLYAYGVINTEHSLNSITGIEGKEIQFLPYKECALIYSEINDLLALKESVSIKNASNDTSVSPLFVHQAVLDNVLRLETVLPFAFGSLFENKEGIQRFLETKYNKIQNHLSTLDNMCEYGLTIFWDRSKCDVKPSLGASESNATGGKAYLLKKYQLFKEEEMEVAKAKELSIEITQRFEKLAKKKIEKYNVSESIMLKGSYLIPRKYQEVLKDKIKQLSSDNLLFKFQCSGPWPPYHFVQL